MNDRRQALDSRIEAFVFAVIQIGDQFLLEVSRAADTGSDRFDAMILAHDCAVPIPTNDSSTVLDVLGCQPSLRSNADMPPSCQSGDCVLCDTAACIHIHALCVPVLCVQWHSAHVSSILTFTAVLPLRTMKNLLFSEFAQYLTARLTAHFFSPYHKLFIESLLFLC